MNTKIFKYALAVMMMSAITNCTKTMNGSSEKSSINGATEDMNAATGNKKTGCPAAGLTKLNSVATAQLEAERGNSTMLELEFICLTNTRYSVEADGRLLLEISGVAFNGNDPAQETIVFEIGHFSKNQRDWLVRTAALMRPLITYDGGWKEPLIDRSSLASLSPLENEELGPRDISRPSGSKNSLRLRFLCSGNPGARCVAQEVEASAVLSTGQLHQILYTVQYGLPRFITNSVDGLSVGIIHDMIFAK